MHTLTRVARRLGFLSTFAVAALCVGPAVGSAMAGLVPTSTTVLASPDLISSSGSATLTATVQYGLLITPTGTVTFTDTTNNAVLGKAKLSGPCLLSLKLCTAQLNVSASQLSAGQNQIQASYGGDLLSAPSSGSTYLYTPENSGDDFTCTVNEPCTDSDTSPDGSAALSVRAGASSGPDTLLLSFSTIPLSCSTPNTGDIGVFDVTDPTVSDDVIMHTYGVFGFNAQTAHPIVDGLGGHVCFDSPTEFTTASGAPATQQPDGSFEGVLAPCVGGLNASNAPCIEGGSFSSTGDGTGTYEINVVVVPSPYETDPKMGP